MFGIRSALVTLNGGSIVGKPFPFILKPFAILNYLLLISSVLAVIIGVGILALINKIFKRPLISFSWYHLAFLYLVALPIIHRLNKYFQKRAYRNPRSKD